MIPPDLLHALRLDPEEGQRLWTAWGGEDPYRFVAWLHEQGHIDQRLYLEWSWRASASCAWTSSRSATSSPSRTPTACSNATTCWGRWVAGPWARSTWCARRIWAVVWR